MEKNNYSKALSWVKKYAMLSLFISAGTFTASATTGTGTITDPYVLTDGETIQITKAGKVYATYAAPQDGILTLTTQQHAFAEYTDASFDESTMIGYVSNTNTANGKESTKAVVGGTTYYFYNFFLSEDEIQVKFSETAVPLALTEVSPAEGSVFNISNTGNLSLSFNHQMTIGSAKLVAGSTEEGLLANVYTNSLSIDLTDVITKMLTNGTLHGGDTFTIVLSDVTDDTNGSKYNGDGTLRLNFIAPKLPISLTSSTNTPDAGVSEFLSYYAPGNSKAVVSLTFSGDLLVPTCAADSAYAEVNYGDVESESGDYYIEKLPCQVAGNVLSIDLSDKRRRPEDMVGSGKDYGNIALHFKNVKAADGNFAMSNTKGGIGSYAFGYTYKVINSEVSCEFTPASGTSLEGVSSIEMYIIGESAITYDGVSFTGTTAGGATVSVTVANSEILKETDPLDASATILTIPVPELNVPTGSDVTVTPANLKTADAMDHSAALTAIYKAKTASTGVQITSANPADGSTLKLLADESTITVTLQNPDAVETLIYSIYDLNPSDPDDACLKSMSYMTKQEDKSFVSTVYGNYALYQGHDYQVIFTAYATEDDFNYGRAALGTAELIYHGDSAGYQNSSVQFLSIDPDPTYSTVDSEDDNTFTLTFDAPVTVSPNETFINIGQGMTWDFESITPNDDKTAWTLTISKSYMSTIKGFLYLTVVAYDMNGARLSGNVGQGLDSYFSFMYVSNIGVPDMTITPEAGTELPHLKTFTLGCGAGIAQSYCVAEPITVYNRMRQAVATVKEITPVIPEEYAGNMSYDPKEVILTLDTTVVEAGTYILSIPQGYFILGSQMDSYNCKQTSFDYTVDGSEYVETPTDVTITPATGSTVDSLYEFTLVFNQEVGIDWNCTELIQLVNTELGEVAATANGDSCTVILADGEWSSKTVSIRLSRVVSDKGTYTLAIPAGRFALGEWGDSSSTALSFDYTITTGAGIHSITAADLKVKVYSLDGRFVKETTAGEALQGLHSGAYLIQGKKVMIK